MAPRDFYRNNGQTYARSYPTVYHLVGVSEKTFLIGGVGNSSFGSVFKKSMGVPDNGTGYPGKIMYIQIVSRVMENRDRVEILK